MKRTMVEVVPSTGKRFSVVVADKEVARAYLYLLHNDLHKEPFGLLEDVFVDENMRGQGIGKLIVQQIISEAKEAGCYKLIATSRQSRDKVHALYQSLGFVDYGKEFRINF